jgi:hypothetical protein
MATERTYVRYAGKTELAEGNPELYGLLQPHVEEVYARRIGHVGGIPGGIGQRLSSLELYINGNFQASVVVDCVQSVDEYYHILGLYAEGEIHNVRIEGPFYD